MRNSRRFGSCDWHLCAFDPFGCCWRFGRGNPKEGRAGQEFSSLHCAFSLIGQPDARVSVK
jgi:hypothetical protein